MGVVSGYFVVVGILIFFWTGIDSISDKTIMHQIYRQVCYLTSFITAGIGYLLIVLNSIKDKLDKKVYQNKEN